MPPGRTGLVRDRARKRRVGPARTLRNATKPRDGDEFVALSAALADPARATEMNERLPESSGHAYLTSHVRR